MDRARALILVALALAPGRAAADPCGADAGDGGPLPLAPGAADFGQLAETCARTAVDVRLRGEAAIDTPDFYGAITTGATLRARLRLGWHWQLMAALDPATLRYSVNAVLPANDVGVGPATLGGAYTAVDEDSAGALYARLLLPFDSARQMGTLWGGELGGVGRRQLRPRWVVQAGVSMSGTLATVGGAGHGVVRPAFLGELAWAPRPWAAVAGGPALRTRFLPTGHVDAFAARLSARLQSRRGFQAALGIDLPVAGHDRTSATVSLFAGWIPAGW
jgi:hypothetical protein